MTHSQSGNTLGGRCDDAHMNDDDYAARLTAAVSGILKRKVRDAHERYPHQLDFEAAASRPGMEAVPCVRRRARPSAAMRTKQ